MTRNGHNPWLNIAVARVIPLLLVALIVYSAYVITKVIAIDYLLTASPSSSFKRRPQSAAAIIAIYYILLIPLVVTYGRLVQTIVTNPGYVPYGPGFHDQEKAKDKRKKKNGRGYHGSRGRAEQTEKTGLPTGTGGDGSETLFWHRDIFVCDADGRPPFCSTCFNYKPDRTHHCSEIDRCVLKMDHFCPWVGGIVSETSFKYFIQFLVYAAFLCIMILVTLAVFTKERLAADPSFLNVNYFALLGVSGLFTLFTVGMAASSLQLAFLNSSTIENLKRKTKVWFLAVLIPSPKPAQIFASAAVNSVPAPDSRPTRKPNASYRTVTYPRPQSEEQFFVDQIKGLNPPSPPPSPPQPSSHLPNGQQSAQTRTFAILSTQPGESPFDVGMWKNACEVMGYTVWEWLLPIKPSPCADHSSLISSFPMDMELIDRLKREALLIPNRNRDEESGQKSTNRARSRKKRHSRRRASHEENPSRDSQTSEESVTSPQNKASERRREERLSRDNNETIR